MGKGYSEKWVLAWQERRKKWGNFFGDFFFLWENFFSGTYPLGSTNRSQQWSFLPRNFFELFFNSSENLLDSTLYEMKGFLGFHGISSHGIFHSVGGCCLEVLDSFLVTTKWIKFIFSVTCLSSFMNLLEVPES